MKLRHPYVLEFLTLHKILKCDNSNESYLQYFRAGAVYYVVQGGTIPFESMDAILMSDQFK